MLAGALISVACEAVRKIKMTWQEGGNAVAFVGKGTGLL